MTKENIFAGLILACVLFACEDSKASAQASQAGVPPANAAVAAPNATAATTATANATTAATTATASSTAAAVVPTTAAIPAVTATHAGTSSNSPTQAVNLPALYGNPFSQAGGITGGAAGSTPNGASAALPSESCTTVEATDPSLAFAFEPDPTGSGPAGGANQLSTPTPNSRPVNPAIKKCEGGRIIIRVENKRFYAYHIGDEIPVSIKILADDGVQLDFTSLKQEILGFQGADFQLIPTKPISIASTPYSQRKHSTLYDIELSVQTFLTKPTVAFNLDLRYAVDVPPGVKQPNWRILTTPDFVITNTPVITMPNDDEVDEGDLHPADMRSSWISWPLMVGGAFMIVWFGFLRRLVIRWNRMRPGRTVPPEEKAWNVFAKVFSDARDYGEFGAQYLRNIDAALRIYLAQSTNMNIESFSITEIAALMGSDPRTLIIVSALTKCESVIYARADRAIKLDESQINELYAELQELVPKPEQ